MNVNSYCIILVGLLLVGYNGFGQRMIEVSYDKTVYLVFPGDIKSHDIGSPDVSHKAEGNKIFLKSNLYEADGKYYGGDDLEVDWYDTNMLVETVEGYFYIFDLTYSNKPKKFFHPFEIEDSDYKSQTAKSLAIEKSSKVGFDGDINNADALEVKEICHKIIEGTDIISDIGDVDGMMQTKVGGIYASRDYLFFKLSLWNESAIPYDIELINFVVDLAGKKQRKLTASYHDNLSPIYVENSNQKMVNDGKEIFKVFVFEKFTIDIKKRLFVQVIENNGDRNTEVEIKPKNIIDAVSVLSLTN